MLALHNKNVSYMLMSIIIKKKFLVTSHFKRNYSSSVTSSSDEKMEQYAARVIKRYIALCK